MKINTKVTLDHSTLMVQELLRRGVVTEEDIESVFYVAAVLKNGLIVVSKACMNAVENTPGSVYFESSALIVSESVLTVYETEREEFNRILGLKPADPEQSVLLPVEVTMGLVQKLLQEDTAQGLRLLELGRILHAGNE